MLAAAQFDDLQPFCVCRTAYRSFLDEITSNIPTQSCVAISQLVSQDDFYLRRDPHQV
jgi:hypothetical protein